MALRLATVLIVVSILITALFTADCVKVRGPGIMPSIEDNIVNEWIVVGEEFHPPRTSAHEGMYQWKITLRYIPGEGSRRINGPDISATFDEDRIPFTFNEADQILETAVSALFGPSLTHLFVISPAEGSTVSFPTFILSID